MSRSGKSETEREKDREINISLHSGRIWFRFVNFAFFFCFFRFALSGQKMINALHSALTGWSTSKRRGVRHTHNCWFFLQKCFCVVTFDLWLRNVCIVYFWSTRGKWKTMKRDRRRILLGLLIVVYNSNSDLDEGGENREQNQGVRNTIWHLYRWT